MYVDPSSHLHGAFELQHEVLGIKPTDQSCHREVWIGLAHANAHLSDPTQKQVTLRARPK